MDLLIDAGNTRLHCLLAGESGGPIQPRYAAVSSAGAAWRPALEVALAVWPKPDRIALVSVRPDIDAELRAWLGQRFGRSPRQVGVELKVAIPNRTRTPETVGHDRLMHATWAAGRCPGQAAIVCSLGTAITYDVVSADGAFIGGVIAAGLGTQARALAAQTAKLPEVHPQAPPPILGQDTPGAIAAGLFWGVVGAVTRTCEELQQAVGGAQVFATGGDAALIAPRCEIISELVEHCALLGLQRTLTLHDAS